MKCSVRMLWQPVRELDEQHPDVLRHREHQLAQVLGLPGVRGLGLDLGKLGDAVHQPFHLAAEHPADIGKRGVVILDRVMQEGGDDRGAVELDVGQNPGDFERMGEIRVARGTDLVAVLDHRIDIGAVYQQFVGIGVVCPDAFRSVRTAGASREPERAYRARRQEIPQRLRI